MTMRYRLLVPTLASVLALAGVSESISAPKGSDEVGRANEDAVFNYLLPVVYSSGKAVRLYYRSECSATKDPVNDAVPFPFVRVQQASKGKTGLVAIREVFERDKNVTVTEESDGMIRIRIGEVPTEILRTKLSLVTLDPMERYNPDEAYRAIVNTNEMEAAMRSLRFRSVWNLSSTRAKPDRNFPRLPATIRNRTAGQLLDEIAKTWAGQVVVVYGVCAAPEKSGGLRRFWLGSAGQY